MGELALFALTIKKRYVSGAVGCFAVACLGMSGSATAAVIDFTGNGGLEASYSFSSGGVDLDVTATTFDNSGPTGDFAWVGQYSDGLGVTSHSGDSQQVDGANRNDLLIFEFAVEITFKEVTFTLVDTNDQFRFFFQDLNTGDLVDFGVNVDIPGSGTATYVFSSTWTGTSFGIGARDNNDNFLVKSLHAMAAEDDPSLLSLPSSLPLFAVGLGLLGLMGWRRNPSAA